MAFKSEAQKRKFEGLLREGKMSQQAFDKMAEGTPAELPERIGKQTNTPEPEGSKDYKRRFGL